MTSNMYFENLKDLLDTTNNKVIEIDLNTKPYYKVRIAEDTQSNRLTIRLHGCLRCDGKDLLKYLRDRGSLGRKFVVEVTRVHEIFTHQDIYLLGAIHQIEVALTTVGHLPKHIREKVEGVSFLQNELARLKSIAPEYPADSCEAVLPLDNVEFVYMDK